MEQDQCANLLQAIAVLQTQIAALQTNMTFLLESVSELKKENGDRRNSIDTFAATTRDRLVKIENELGLGKWAITILVGGMLALAGGKLYSVLIADTPQIHHDVKR